MLGYYPTNSVYAGEMCPRESGGGPRKAGVGVGENAGRPTPRQRATGVGRHVHEPPSTVKHRGCKSYPLGCQKNVLFYHHNVAASTPRNSFSCSSAGRLEISSNFDPTKRAFSVSISARSPLSCFARLNHCCFDSHSDFATPNSRRC